MLNIVILLGSLVVESDTLDSVATASLPKISFEDNDYTDARFSKPLEEPESIHNIILGLEVIDVLLSVISVVTSSLLIFGICQSRYKFIFPTLLWMPLDFAIYLVSIVVIFLFGVYPLEHYLLVVEIFFSLSLSLICWLFVYSFWQQVRYLETNTFLVKDL